MQQLLRVFTIIFFCFPLHGMMDRALFEIFPKEITLCILDQILIKNDDFKETAQGIFCLRRINKFHKQYFNAEITLHCIKRLSEQFNIANEDIANSLPMKESFKRFVLQTGVIHQRTGSIAHIKKSYRYGLDLNFTYGGGLGWSIPLIVMCFEQHNRPVVDWLIEKGADINACDHDGNNICMLSLKSGRLSNLEPILRHKELKLDHQNKNGDTMLHICMQTMPVISSTSGISDNIVYRYGPLCDIVKILLERKANPTIENNDEDTPLRYLLKQKYWNDISSKPGNAQKTIFSDIIPMLKMAEVDFNAQKNMNDQSK